ncbi:uncharacterized protein G2W53_026873 [Senna tora]|uniref:Uncharacterized protein n=1 Tax=Senna tora TaxID=362788 RepID=A0A834WHU8_9FABA|nr:uncharacterized protein G2W53_026873 [Senna tora]
MSTITKMVAQQQWYVRPATVRRRKHNDEGDDTIEKQSFLDGDGRTSKNGCLKGEER